MFERTTLALIWFICAIPAEASAQDANLLPSSKWVVNYSPDACNLARSFGDGDQKIVAQFVRNGPSEGFKFNLIGQSLAHWVIKRGVRLRFGEAGEPVVKYPLVGEAIDKSRALIMDGRLDNLQFPTPEAGKLSASPQETVNKFDPSVEAAITSAWIQAGDHSITLHLGSMREPMAALKKCTDDIIRSWGFDPQAQAQLAKLPTPADDPSTWFSIMDYPTESLRRNESALVSFRLMVAADGSVSGCFLQTVIGAQALANFTCNLLQKRAKFNPARTTSGAPVPSYYLGRAKWVTGPTVAGPPRAAPPPPGRPPRSR